MTSEGLLVTIAEIDVAFRFQFTGTRMLFLNFEHKAVPVNYNGPCLSVDKNKIVANSYELNCTQEFAEFCCLLEETADFLTLNNTTIYHGVAFIYERGAYILTAPSGTGKSTQYRNLRTMYGPGIRIINGDKPALGRNSDGQIIVYPSPWTGKERWAGKDKAPLHGLILLEQGQTNIVKTMDIQEAVLPVMEEFIYTARSRESVHTVCRMADSMLRRTPLYRFINKGDAESSAMLYDLITRVEKLWD
ncbi:MAG: hypothetical protein K6G34_09705 [Lachnospiraceae bacterium]|nr:hypothetical protein [Lachnospiraceae bacterium]